MKNTEETGLIVRHEGIGIKFKNFISNILGGKKKRKKTIEYNPLREMPRVVERTSFNIIHNENSQIYEESKIENIKMHEHKYEHSFANTQETYEEYFREKKLAKEIENNNVNFAEKTAQEIKEMVSQMGKYIEYLRAKIKNKKR